MRWMVSYNCKRRWACRHYLPSEVPGSFNCRSSSNGGAAVPAVDDWRPIPRAATARGHLPASTVPPRQVPVYNGWLGGYLESSGLGVGGLRVMAEIA
jgi:hypothetical protein